MPVGGETTMAVARQLFSKYIDNHYVPEWNLIYRNQSDEDVLSDDFEALCQQLIVPLWETAHVSNEEH